MALGQGIKAETNAKEGLGVLGEQGEQQAGVVEPASLLISLPDRHQHQRQGEHIRVEIPSIHQEAVGGEHDGEGQGPGEPAADALAQA